MSQADFLSIKKGKARVVIKTNPDDTLPKFELDWVFSKSEAMKILIYAIQLKAQSEGLNKEREV